jgi:hypothetical protein
MLPAQQSETARSCNSLEWLAFWRAAAGVGKPAAQIEATPYYDAEK